MRYFVDTNILLRFLNRADPNYTAARSAVRIIKARGDEVVTSAQNMAEFWNAMTRPVTARGGYGLTPQDAAFRLQFIERHFPLLPDSPLVYQEWKQLVITLRIAGVQVHDARIAALMRVHNVTKILTLNTKDFARYPAITALTPQQI